MRITNHDQGTKKEDVLRNNRLGESFFGSGQVWVKIIDDVESYTFQQLILRSVSTASNVCFDA